MTRQNTTLAGGALGHTADGAAVEIDLDRLIGSHACVVANAGAGKSALIRRLLETTYGLLPHIVLDGEDEFYTLREKFSYVIAGGDGADAPATIAGAADLARAALRHGFSLIVQLNDLGPGGAQEYVGAFLEALMSAPRDLWRPLLVVLDEAHRFAPQDGATAATHGVHSLTAQGRKRGFTAVLASQRIAKIDANVRGDINNWLIGRVGQALDRRTMADQLGFSAREGRERLQAIEPRHFWGFGPALLVGGANSQPAAAAEPILLRVADVETTPVRPGQAKIATPPAPEDLQAILAGLAKAAPEPGPEPEPEQWREQDADSARNQANVEAFAKDAQIAELQADNARLRAVRDDALSRAIRAERELAELHVQYARRGDLIRYWDAFGGAVRAAVEGVPSIETTPHLFQAPPQSTTLRGQSAAAPEPPPPGAPSKRGGGGGQDGPTATGSAPVLGGSAAGASHAAPRPAPASPPPPRGPGDWDGRGRRALQALAAYPAGLSERQWAWVGGFSRKGGTWGTYKSALRAAGLVEERDGRWRTTVAGDRAAAADPGEFPPIGPELARWWGRKLSGVGRMVEVLLKRWPHAVTRDGLAADLGMAADGGTFGTYLSRLRRAGMLQEQGKRIRLHPELMEYEP